MSKYRIVLDGKTYEMEVDLVQEGDTVRPAAEKKLEVSKDEKRAAVPAPAAEEQEACAPKAGAVIAPMPGVVIRVEKNVGDKVKSGELVLVLEAMKMENEILAPTDGSIVAINCTSGTTVNGGDVLFEIK